MNRNSSFVNNHQPHGTHLFPPLYAYSLNFYFRLYSSNIQIQAFRLNVFQKKKGKTVKNSNLLFFIFYYGFLFKFCSMTIWYVPTFVYNIFSRPNDFWFHERIINIAARIHILKLKCLTFVNKLNFYYFSFWFVCDFFFFFVFFYFKFIN